jgi:HEPN domain-containing protein
MNAADLVKEWFEFAVNDLRAARHIFENMRPKPLEISCYHCQQAVEKALKGFLLHEGIEPPKIHDLRKLCLLCAERNPAFAALQDVCRDLTSYAVAARYPSNPEITEEDTRLALKEADRIYAFCAALVSLSEQEKQE